MKQTTEEVRYAVLFVDDEEKALKYFKRAFSRDFRILTAVNVGDARVMLEAEGDEIGVLVTDQRMPGEKGVDLLNYTREEYPQIVRLLTTAYSDLTDAIEAVNQGEILRYITKPWDIQALRGELRHAMDFFLLRRERDLLLKEKFSVRQRMVEVDRVRDLLVMAGSFSQVRYPLQAIRAFLLQFSGGREQPPLAEEKNLDLWGLVESEIQQMLGIAAHIIEVTATEGSLNDFKSTTLPILWEEACGRREGLSASAVEAAFAPDLPQIRVNPTMLGRLFEILLARAVHEEAIGPVRISAQSAPEGVQITVHTQHPLWPAASPLAFSPDLLSLFFICYHHSGTLSIKAEASCGTRLDILLPPDPSHVHLPALEPFWLDEIFAQYET